MKENLEELNPTRFSARRNSRRGRSNAGARRRDQPMQRQGLFARDAVVIKIMQSLLDGAEYSRESGAKVPASAMKKARQVDVESAGKANRQ
ncbi:hypothetical protein MASR1M12_34710 [Erysipelotrichia bacterium]